MALSQANPEEEQYLQLVRDLLSDGDLSETERTGVGTLNTFGRMMRFSLRDGRIPVLTTKRVAWSSVVEELLWILAGHTDAGLLRSHIWDKNGTLEALAKRGITDRRANDLGPVYGFQYRHFGAVYTTCDADYTGQGVDQIAWVINEIKTNPSSRQLVISAWNPSDMAKMALPPCHVMCQFYVNPETNELSAMMTQRSADMGLGVPFNIASYALLTHMVAHVCGLKPGEFVHSFGIPHVYLNHVEALKEQVTREPRPFPTVTFARPIENILDFTAEDISLVCYDPHPRLKMEMAV